MSLWVNLGENFKKLLSYFTSTPLNLSNPNSYVKQKIPKFGTNNALFWYN